jgi:Domain of unknown function (DUF5911)
MTLFRRRCDAAASPPQTSPPPHDPSGRVTLYPRIAELIVIGDRRTAAVIAPDGSIGWLCLPAFDGAPVFGRLLDARRGGYWRLGPAEASNGSVSYIDNTNVAVTRWQSEAGDLELTDAMLLPKPDPGAGERGQVTLLRRLCCRRGAAECVMELAPRDQFGAAPIVKPVPGGWELRLAGKALGLWTTRAETEGDPARRLFHLDAGQYIHPAGFVLAGPDARISRYFFGVAAATPDLQAGLSAAAQGQVLSPLERLVLLCHIEGTPLGRFTVPVVAALMTCNIAAGTALLFLFAAIRRRRHG